MKTLNNKTLNEFLSIINERRRLYGDMFMTKLRHRKGQMVIRFSEQTKIYRFNWDKEIHSWVLTDG